MSMLKNVAWVEKLHRSCEYTSISFKCQSIRSKVHCTNKTLHNESQKNVTVHLGPRVTCEKNMTACHDCLFWSVCFVKEREINEIKTTRLSFLADSFTLPWNRLRNLTSHGKSNVPELLQHSFFTNFFIAYPSDLQLDASDWNPLTPKMVWILSVFLAWKPFKEHEG